MITFDWMYVLAPAMAVLVLLIAASMLASDLLPEVQEFLTRRKHHHQLLDDMNRLALPRMLSLHGIAVNDFVAATTMPERRSAVINCRGCTNNARCEAVLHGYIDVDSYAFCPNHELFARIRTQRLAKAA